MQSHPGSQRADGRAGIGRALQPVSQPSPASVMHRLLSTYSRKYLKTSPCPCPWMYNLSLIERLKQGPERVETPFWTLWEDDVPMIKRLWEYYYSPAHSVPRSLRSPFCCPAIIGLMEAFHYTTDCPGQRPKESQKHSSPHPPAPRKLDKHTWVNYKGW